MRKHNFLKAVALTLCMALFVSGTAFAATPGQALDAKEVNYGTLSRADQNILKSMFNAEEYAAMNEDVVNAVGKDANKLFAHFIKYGVFEGRGPSKSFNVSAYMSSYGDLQKAFGKDIMAYYRHYNNYGKKEKRELVTVEKAEAAGVVIKSVTGATKTVLPPSLQNPSSGASSSSGTPAVDTSTRLSPTMVIFTEGLPPTTSEVSVLNLPDINDVSGAEDYDWTVTSENSSIATATHTSGTTIEITRTATGLSAPTSTNISVNIIAVDADSNPVGEALFNGTITVMVYPQSVLYSVTNTLTHVTNDNVIVQYGAGESYSATLAAESGYTINSVTVTMGGTDITATAYDSGTGAVTITSISGNIVITATATESGGGDTATALAGSMVSIIGAPTGTSTVDASDVTLSLTNGETPLTVTTDYTVTYEYVAATSTVKPYYKATIAATGTNYTGSVVEYYTSSWSTTAPDATSWGKTALVGSMVSIEGAPTGTDPVVSTDVSLSVTDGAALTVTTDYTVAYAYVAATADVGAYYTATITGTGDNYTGTVVKYYTNAWGDTEPDNSWTP